MSLPLGYTQQTAFIETEGWSRPSPPVVHVPLLAGARAMLLWEMADDVGYYVSQDGVPVSGLLLENAFLIPAPYPHQPQSLYSLQGVGLTSGIYSDRVFFDPIPVYVFKGIVVKVIGHNVNFRYERAYVHPVNFSIVIHSITEDSFVIEIAGTSPVVVESLTPDTDYTVFVQVFDNDIVAASNWRLVRTGTSPLSSSRMQPLTTLHQQIGNSSIRVVRTLHPIF